MNAICKPLPKLLTAPEENTPLVYSSKQGGRAESGKGRAGEHLPASPEEADERAFATTMVLEHLLHDSDAHSRWGLNE